MSLIAASHAFCASAMLFADAVSFQVTACHERVAEVVDGDLLRGEGRTVEAQYLLMLGLLDATPCISQWLVVNRRGERQIFRQAGGATGFSSWALKSLSLHLTGLADAECLYGNRYLRNRGRQRLQVIWRLGWPEALLFRSGRRDALWFSLSVMLAAAWLLLAAFLGDPPQSIGGRRILQPAGNGKEIGR